uniref:Uncharacterized protein n=1 Tax=Anguilla anguilla TaxID=7936 RepID=A0A0E9X7V8_ANGAN
MSHINESWYVTVFVSIQTLGGSKLITGASAPLDGLTHLAHRYLKTREDVTAAVSPPSCYPLNIFTHLLNATEKVGHEHAVTLQFLSYNITRSMKTMMFQIN